FTRIPPPQTAFSRLTLPEGRVGRKHDAANRSHILIPEAVDDRVAAVAAEIAGGDFHARGGLPALVFRDVEEVFDALHEIAFMPALDDLAHRHFLLDEAVENVVKRLVGRERILVLLVGTKLGGRRPRD